MSLIARAEDLSIASVEAVLRTMINLPVGNPDSGSPLHSWFAARDWPEELESGYHFEQRQVSLTRFCKELFNLAQEPRSHLKEIDQSLSRLIDCAIDLKELKEADITVNDLVLRGLDLLQRLPSTPLELVGFPTRICKDYLYDSVLPRKWSSLQTAKFFGVTTIKMALFIASTADSTTEDSYPDVLAKLLDVSSQLASFQASHPEWSHYWYIVRAALYSSWQRSVHLCQYSELGRRLSGTIDQISGGSRLHLRGPASTLGLSAQDLEIQAVQGKAESMCSWTFRVLRIGAVGSGMDFRTFHSRYNRVRADAPGRCRKHSTKSCAGRGPDHCRRFHGMRIADQSMHDYKCLQSCKRLYWNEESYRATSGSRAVRLDEFKPGRSQLIEYCCASDKTLAISHVWSHGQGGRPHEGVNACLHNRYVDIAKRLGCDSYWWDSLCIPTDHNLRVEAIRYINSTFASSKATLICDKDLMSIDMGDQLLIDKESLLSALLVSDWNVRAWTFLEGLRSRQRIHILCKDNVVIYFRQMVKDVYDFGHIDLSILAFNVSHILPNFTPPIPRKIRNRGGIFHPRDDENHTRILYMRREAAGSVLSLRPASRKGDDIVIWSLLTGEDISDTPSDLWQRNYSPRWLTWPRPPGQVNTGFLMSSARRMQHRGRSWAPCTSYCRPSSSPYLHVGPLYPAYDSAESFLEDISTRGLVSDWLCYEFSSLHQAVCVSSWKDRKMHKIWRKFLVACTWGALLQPVTDYFHRETRTADSLAFRYPGLIAGTMVAVLGSRTMQRPSLKPTDERGWVWKGVFVWDRDVPLPKFTYVKDLLIE